MHSMRFGLAGLGGPKTQRELYGDLPRSAWADAYADRFGALELPAAAEPTFSGETALGVVQGLRPVVHVLPRLDDRGTGHGEAAIPAHVEAWARKVAPITRAVNGGPVRLVWDGPYSDARADDLATTLDALWNALPSRQRVAVDFGHRTWFRSDVAQVLEEHQVAMVWSTRAGPAPRRVTSDFLYIRLTGKRHGRSDEVAAFADHARWRADSGRPVYVISAMHVDPYGLQVLRRFAALAGAPLPEPPTETYRQSSAPVSV